MPTIPGFDDTLFPITISRGMVGGPMFHTTVATSSSGYETRNQDWTAARLEWQFAHQVTDSTILATLIAFFRARGGMARGFRFRDWTDYSVGCSWNGSGFTYQSGGYQQFATGDGTTTVFQLTKAYPDALNATVRPITRPVSGSVQIWFAGVQQLSGWTVDTTTGLVTFTSAPTSGTVIQWAGAFDVPARFDVDKMSLTANTLFTGNWGGVKIIEIKGA